MISILLLLVLIWFLLKIPAVQNWLGQKITDRLSKTLKTKVTVKKIGFSLFNKLDIEGLYIEDLKKDTLLYAGLAQVKITDWFFLKDQPELSFINLEHTFINTYRTDSIWNYQFILDRLSTKSKDTSKKDGISLAIKYVVLKDIHVLQNDHWLGQNQEIKLGNLVLKANEIHIQKKLVDIAGLEINQPVFIKRDYPKNKPPEINSIETETSGNTTKKWELFGWKITIDDLKINNGNFQLDKQTQRAPFAHFDGQHLLFTNINLHINQFKWISDTIRFNTEIAAKEKSGLVVTHLKSSIKAYPNTIEFNALDLLTPNSNITNKLAFSFQDFNKDINDFIHKIHMQGNFTDTKVSSKDLAFFAPKLKGLDKEIRINGIVEGTVDKLTGYDIFLSGGNTFLKGNLSLLGLPDLNETYIDFTKGNLSTSYTDVVAFLPSLKNIKGVALDKLNQINYTGNFTGFINDFVTYGTLQTNLGSVTTDINMKLPDNGLPAYSGKISTDNFRLGSLLKNDKLGGISFSGKVSGTGFEFKNLNAKIDGNTSRIDFDNYTYQNILTKGEIKNKKFEGLIKANDPNLIASLEGLIDFNNPIPLFDLKAHIERSNFKNLRFLKEDYSLTGDAVLKFSGNTIDNFDGFIQMDNASLRKDNKNLSFSFLNLQSVKTVNGRKLTLNSNEIDGFIEGKFSYRNIVNAFGLFLHRYYPAIFSKPKKFDNNQDFTFDLKARNIDDYTTFFGKAFRGFNQANLNGMVNTNTNEANFHGNIPVFSVNETVVLNNLILDGYGTTDSLVIDANVGKLTINDSLSFYDTRLNIETINAISSFSLITDGTKSLNKLDINGLMLVSQEGVQLNFEKSSFTINDKEWILEENGELILKKDVIAANDLIFTNKDQQIKISSVTDDIGNHSNLVADISNLEIGDFTPLLIKSNNFRGKLNGKITVFDPVSNPVITTESVLTDFWKDNDSIGKINLTGNFNIAKKQAGYKLISNNPDYIFDIAGTYNGNDSMGNTFWNKILSKGIKISIIENYLSGVFKNIQGLANTDLEIFGTANRQFITGKVDIKDSLKMTVKYTNVSYIVQPGTVNFFPDVIEFSKLKIRDTLKNEGTITKGKLYHDGFFKKMNFDLEVNSDKMMLINTDKNLSPVFYGYALGDAKLKLKGPVEDLNLGIVINNPADADITLNTNTQSKTLGKADFIEFKTYGTEMEKSKKIFSNNMTVDMLLNANTNAKIKVILDDLAGDNITARGNGNLKIGITGSGDVSINGSYTVEQGDYDFSLQSWFRKPFIIQKGSTINWAGNPYDATININAKYLASKVSLNDLLSSINSNSTYSSANLEVTALMTKSLSKPDIKFGINYVSGTQKSDPQIDNILDLIRKDESVLNKQVAFLVLFDRLLPYSTAVNIRNEGVSVGINTLSGLLAKEATSAVNRLLKDAFRSGNVQANIDFRTYSPGGIQASVAERASSNVGLQWNLLDNRTTINVSGNFDFGILGNQNSFQLLPNFVLEYKLKQDGSIVGTLFHRQALDALQTDTDRNKRLSSGGGISWRKEADDFWTLFGLRKKKKIIPPNK